MKSLSLSLALLFTFYAHATVTLTPAASPSVNAGLLQGRIISVTAPTDTQVLGWDAASSSWKPVAATAGSGSVTSVAATVPSIFSISGSPITTTGTLAMTYSGTALPVANGGTGLTAGTSGGVLAYTATGTLASSGALTANQLIKGGGAGVAPSTLAAGSQYQVLVMGATTPGYGTIDLAQSASHTGILPNANTTADSANTASAIVARDGSGNFTAGTVTATHTGRVNSTQVVETVTAGGTCSTSYNVDPTAGTMINLTLNGACAIGVTSLAAGHSFTIKLTQSSTTLPTFTSAYKWTTATTPTFSSSATKYDMIACVSLDGTTLDCNALVDVR